MTYLLKNHQSYWSTFIERDFSISFCSLCSVRKSHSISYCLSRKCSSQTVCSLTVTAYMEKKRLRCREELVRALKCHNYGISSYVSPWKFFWIFEWCKVMGREIQFFFSRWTKSATITCNCWRWWRESDFLQYLHLCFQYISMGKNPD